MFPFLLGNEKSNTGQSDMNGQEKRHGLAKYHSIRSDEPADRIGLREIFVVQCEKYSDIFRTRPKKQRELQQLAQNTIVAIKCSFRLGSRPWIRFRFYVENPTVPPLAGKQPRQYFLGLSAAP